MLLFFHLWHTGTCITFFFFFFEVTQPLGSANRRLALYEISIYFPLLSPSSSTCTLGMTDEVPLEDFTLTRSVQTSSGKLQGFKDEANQVDVFLGIPYAEPPVGSLRFRPTVPLDTPNTERTCTAHAPAAPQTAMPFDTLMCVEINYQSEDCLYLNVWRPSHSSTDKPKPVIVWFHPGACLRHVRL